MSRLLQLQLQGLLLVLQFLEFALPLQIALLESDVLLFDNLQFLVKLVQDFKLAFFLERTVEVVFGVAVTAVDGGAPFLGGTRALFAMKLSVRLHAKERGDLEL